MTPYRKAPCGMFVKPADYEAHLEDCQLCKDGLEDTSDWPDDKKADDPRRVPYSNLGRRP